MPIEQRWASFRDRVSHLWLGVSGPGHAPHRFRADDMLAWSIREVGDMLALFPNARHVIMRNPFGQIYPAHDLPQFVAGDFGQDWNSLQLDWSAKFADFCGHLGLKIILYGHTPHRVNTGTLRHPNLVPLSLDTVPLAVKDISSAMEYMNADQMAFDAFRWADEDARTELVEELSSRGYNIGVEVVPNEEPGEEYAYIETLYQLVGNMPRGEWDDETDSPHDRRDRPTVSEVMARIDEHNHDQEVVLVIDHQIMRGVPPELEEGRNQVSYAISNWQVKRMLNRIGVVDDPARPGIILSLDEARPDEDPFMDIRE